MNQALTYKIVREINGEMSTITATTENGYFSVTCSGKNFGGCMHDEIAEVAPELIPLIKLHLSNVDTGEPLYAVKNGFYWLAGAEELKGEKYHGGNGWDTRTPQECIETLSKHIRETPGATSFHVMTIMHQAKNTAKANDWKIPGTNDICQNKSIAQYARKRWTSWVADKYTSRWKQEAEDGLKLMKELIASSA
jgi:hypothetical protein